MTTVVAMPDPATNIRRISPHVASLPRCTAEAKCNFRFEHDRATNTSRRVFIPPTEEERTALELCYTRGLSHEEAARVMDCPTGTLKTHILRAKERLKSFLAVYSAHA